jgi:glycosyltransferase involved in cell wall biosynthesis
MSTVCLSMIVKNETHIIHECLESVYKHIDYWVIVDTGSTDGTQELIKQFFADKGIPGELHERPWVGFGHNRTEALGLCDGKADYAWMIDADDRILGEFKYPHGKNLTADGYALKCSRDNCIWWRNQIFKTGIGWKYVGVLHEYAHCDKQPLIQEKIEGNYGLEARTLGHRNVNVTPIEKYSKDAETLLEALKTEPTNSRYQFYLAQSYFDSQQWDKATEAYYKRVEMGGWEEECYYSLFRVALIAIAQEKPWDEIQRKLLDAYDYRPCRAEPLHMIARALRGMNRTRAAYLFAKEAAQLPHPQQDILFIDTNVYKWMALDELAATAFYVHDYKLGYAACTKLLQENLLPSSEVQRVRTNLEAYSQKIREMERAIQHAQQMQNKQAELQQINPSPKSAYIPPRAARFKERKR